MRILAGDPLGPGVLLSECLREHEAIVERAAAVGVVHDLLADRVQSDALGPFVDALKIAALLAIELGQRARLTSMTSASVSTWPSSFRALDVEAGGAGEVNVVAGSRRR